MSYSISPLLVIEGEKGMIGVLGISPGPINTPLASRQSQDVIARIVSTIPMGRMGEPDEVAKVALFLASDDSSFLTGIELFVDGGRAQI